MTKNILIILTIAGASLQAATFTDMSKPAINWADVNIDNELNTDLNEIYQSAHLSSTGDNAALSRPVYGDSNYNSHINKEWDDRYAQSSIENLCLSFIPDSRLWTLNENTNDIQNITLNYTNWPEFAHDAGISSIGWRRTATNWPANWQSFSDSAYSFGKAQDGDIRGPWVKDDLQRAVSTLKYSLIHYDPGDGSWRRPDWSSTNAVVYQSYFVNSTDSYSQAISDSQASYSNRTDEWNDHSAPEASFYGSHEHSGTWAASAHAYKNKMVVSVPPKTVKVFFYAYGVAPGDDTNHYEFDADGSGLLENQWTLVDVVAVSNCNAETNIISKYIGSTAYPHPVPEPDTNTIWKESGYKIRDIAAIIQQQWTYSK